MPEPAREGSGAGWLHIQRERKTRNWSRQSRPRISELVSRVFQGIVCSAASRYSSRPPTPKAVVCPQRHYSCACCTFVGFSSEGRRRYCDDSQASPLSIIHGLPRRKEATRQRACRSGGVGRIEVGSPHTAPDSVRHKEDAACLAATLVYRSSPVDALLDMNNQVTARRGETFAALQMRCCIQGTRPLVIPLPAPSSEIDLLTNSQCDNRAEHPPRRRHRGANPRPSHHNACNPAGFRAPFTQLVGELVLHRNNPRVAGPTGNVRLLAPIIKNRTNIWRYRIRSEVSEKEALQKCI
ncbi:hypothetical protein PR048_019016 [Dryococelus australis]|uniref:Uncharacterized protein n=1 Tax=Dryococelus australis TaxID=614101 RepID=A0ABQ9H2M7_9NEOP|nr:hypothetical protein PR048_019016 [Dryococelus australis]